MDTRNIGKECNEKIEKGQSMKMGDGGMECQIVGRGIPLENIIKE